MLSQSKVDREPNSLRYWRQNDIAALQMMDLPWRVYTAQDPASLDAARSNLDQLNALIQREAAVQQRYQRMLSRRAMAI